MKKWILAIAATALVTAALTAVATRSLSAPPAADDGAAEGTLRSAVLDEDRPFLVHLPESYAREAGRRYPVLYVLDGGSQSAHTAASAALLARIGAMPEAIVVGVPSMSAETRARDYTPPGMRQDVDAADGPQGAADRFLAFLRDELVPRIEHDYRTDRPRMLAGFSRGALFVVYSLLAEPALFDARFGHSPALWRENDALVAQLDGSLASSRPPGGFLFLSLGERETAKMTAAFRHAVATLERRAPATLRWRAAITPGADHHDNAQLATPVGLYALFGARDPDAPGRR